MRAAPSETAEVEADAGWAARLGSRLDAAEAALRAARRIDERDARRGPGDLAPGDDAALRREARRLRPWLETVAGRPYGRLPALSFRRGLEARLAGPWSQYLTLGLGVTRLVRMTPAESARPALPTILAHELAHRYAFDESLTTLRGLEVSARLAAEGDRRHAVSARLELARVLLGGAMAEAHAAGRPEAVDAWLDARADDPRVARARATWRAVRQRPAAAGTGWLVTVYQRLPLRELERAAEGGERASRPLPFPRFALDSAQAAACLVYTAADRLTGRRAEPAPLDATLDLWREAHAGAP